MDRYPFPDYMERMEEKNKLRTIKTNAHTHLELSGLQHVCPQEPMPFLSWVYRLASNIKQSDEELRRGIQAGIEALQRAGTTHIMDITATWETIEPLMQSGLSGIVYLEVMGFTRKSGLASLEEAKRVILDYRNRQESAPIRVGLSVHAPYTCHADLFRAGAAWCKAENIPLCVHIAESPLERVLFTGGDPFSPKHWMIRLLARVLSIRSAKLAYKSSIAYLHALGVLEARPLLAHAIQVDDHDISLIAASGAHVAHCPRSNHLLSCGRMPLEKYLAAGIDVYLGTDSLTSSPSLDVADDVEFARRLHHGRVDEDRIVALMHKSIDF